MQQCGHCNAQQFDGAIFCSECGASLLKAGPRRETTASLGARQSDPSGAATDAAESPSVVPAPAVRPGGYIINLVVLNSGRRLTLDASEDLLIGRKDNARGIYPDVDLGLDGGYESGVSRRHAIISLHNGVCVLEDLESANGTFVNGRRAPPHRQTPVNHGDELKFGTLILRFETG